jgi:hypothetical protein
VAAGEILFLEAQTTVAAAEMCVGWWVMCGVADGGSVRGRRTVVQVGGGGGAKMEVEN